MNAKKSVGFSSDERHPVRAALQGVPFPVSPEFQSLGVGVRTTDASCSGPLILKRIPKACSMLDRVHGAQGNFERRCDVISRMITATGLHAAEIVPLRPKDLLPFEAKVMKTIWGPSRPRRAKEIFFALLCKGHRIAPTLMLKYHRILWLEQLCRTRGAGQITAQAIWETGHAYSAQMWVGGHARMVGMDSTRTKRPPPLLWRQKHSEARGA